MIFHGKVSQPYGMKSPRFTPFHHLGRSPSTDSNMRRRHATASRSLFCPSFPCDALFELSTAGSAKPATERRLVLSINIYCWCGGFIKTTFRHSLGPGAVRGISSRGRRKAEFIGSLKACFVTESSGEGFCRAFRVQYHVLIGIRTPCLSYAINWVLGPEDRVLRGWGPEVIRRCRAPLYTIRAKR